MSLPRTLRARSSYIHAVTDCADDELNNMAEVVTAILPSAPKRAQPSRLPSLTKGDSSIKQMVIEIFSPPVKTIKEEAKKFTFEKTESDDRPEPERRKHSVTITIPGLPPVVKNFQVGESTSDGETPAPPVALHRRRASLLVTSNGSHSREQSPSSPHPRPLYPQVKEPVLPAWVELEGSMNQAGYVVQEMLETELGYLRTLSQLWAELEKLYESFMSADKDADQGIQSLLVALSKISEVHWALYGELEESKNCESLCKSIAPKLKEAIAFYTIYLVYHTRVKEKLTRLLGSTKQRKKSHLTSELEFENMFISPLQRLTKYDLLLKSLCDKYPKCCEGCGRSCPKCCRGTIHECKKQMEGVVFTVNQAVKSCQNTAEQLLPGQGNVTMTGHDSLKQVVFLDITRGNKVLITSSQLNYMGRAKHWEYSFDTIDVNMQPDSLNTFGITVPDKKGKAKTKDLLFKCPKEDKLRWVEAFSRHKPAETATVPRKAHKKQRSVPAYPEGTGSAKNSKGPQNPLKLTKKRSSSLDRDPTTGPTYDAAETKRVALKRHGSFNADRLQESPKQPSVESSYQDITTLLMEKVMAVNGDMIRAAFKEEQTLSPQLKPNSQEYGEMLITIPVQWNGKTLIADSNDIFFSPGGMLQRPRAASIRPTRSSTRRRKHRVSPRRAPLPSRQLSSSFRENVNPNKERIAQEDSEKQDRESDVTSTSGTSQDARSQQSRREDQTREITTDAHTNNNACEKKPSLVSQRRCSTDDEEIGMDKSTSFIIKRGPSNHFPFSTQLSSPEGDDSDSRSNHNSQIQSNESDRSLKAPSFYIEHVETDSDDSSEREYIDVSTCNSDDCECMHNQTTRATFNTTQSYPEGKQVRAARPTLTSRDSASQISAEFLLSLLNEKVKDVNGNGKNSRAKPPKISTVDMETQTDISDGPEIQINSSSSRVQIGLHSNRSPTLSSSSHSRADAHTELSSPVWSNRQKMLSSPGKAVLPPPVFSATHLRVGEELQIFLPKPDSMPGSKFSTAMTTATTTAATTTTAAATTTAATTTAAAATAAAATASATATTKATTAATTATTKATPTSIGREITLKNSQLKSRKTATSEFPSSANFFIPNEKAQNARESAQSSTNRSKTLQAGFRMNPGPNQLPQFGTSAASPKQPSHTTDINLRSTRSPGRERFLKRQRSVSSTFHTAAFRQAPYLDEMKVASRLTTGIKDRIQQLQQAYQVPALKKRIGSEPDLLASTSSAGKKW